MQDNPNGLGEVLLILLMVRQRPPGWREMVERFIVGQRKNSFYLSRVFGSLRHEWRTSFASEATRQGLLRLAAMAVAKHETGVRHPNQKLVQKAVVFLEEQQSQGEKQ